MAFVCGRPRFAPLFFLVEQARKKRIFWSLVPFSTLVSLSRLHFSLKSCIFFILHFSQFLIMDLNQKPSAAFAFILLLGAHAFCVSFVPPIRSKSTIMHSHFPSIHQLFFPLFSAYPRSFLQAT